MSFKVILVDDEKMVLNSLALGIDWEIAGFKIIEKCQHSLEAFDRICKLKPDVVFVDIKMPHLNGLELMKKVKSVLPNLKFVIISGHAEFAYVQKALSYGASAYCLKPFEDDELYEILSTLREKLEQEQEMLECALLSLLEVRTDSALQHFMRLMSVQGIVLNNMAVGISIGSIADFIDDDINFLEIHAINNEYFYFFSDPTRIQNISFQLKITTAISNQLIRNFAFCCISNLHNNILHAFDLLKDKVYNFFFKPLEPINLISFEVVEPPSHQSSFSIKEIEGAACKNNIVDTLNLLITYRTSFANDNPCIKNAIKLYNICISLLYRLNENYDDDPIQNEGSLITAFNDCDTLINYLIKMLSEYSSNNINMDLIKNNTFKQILEYINKNFTNTISFQQICSTYSINPSYLSQLFKKEIGMTSTDYITQLRINYAKDLLCKTNLLVSEISQKVGYEQYFYFAKLFKKVTTMSPKQYRESNH
ncbi:MAG: response regulator [Cellulosilyticaceae bacterium]